MISTASLLAALGDDGKLFRLEIVEECRSTNSILLSRAADGAPSGSVLIAQRQTAGRGRLGRPWYASPSASLTFSMLWRLPENRSPLGLPLAAGVAIAQALEAAGEEGLALKWPNDLLRHGRKVGGILVELASSAAPAAVIGVGLNLALPENLPADLQQSCDALQGPHDPSLLLAALLRHLASACARFADEGFAPFREPWRVRHAYEGRWVELSRDGAPICVGLCQGVDENGALLLATEAGCEKIYAGEISVRPR